MQENASYLNRKLNSYLCSLLYNSSLDTVILEWEYWKIVQNNFSSRIKIQSNWGLTSSLPVSVCLAAWYYSSPCHFHSFFFFFFVGSAHHCQTNPDGEASWKRTIRWGVDGQMEGWKSCSQSLFHHRRSQLVPRNRDLPNRSNASWKHPW